MSFNAPVVGQELGNATPVLKMRTGVFALSPARNQARSMSQASADQIVARLIRDAFPLHKGDEAQATTCLAGWGQVVKSAEENAVAPLLYASLKRLGRESELPVEYNERLRVEYIRSDTANWLALQELQVLLAEFEKAQIPVVVLKGGALATTLYPEPSLRPMSDLDLLIPRASLAQVEVLLIERGYISPVEMGESFGPQLTNYRAYERGGKRPAHLEIHWHLFKSPFYCQRVPIDWFWDHTIEIIINQQRARVFANAAQFLHLASHFALHHRAERLIWSYDLALMLAQDGTPMDWQLVVDTAERFGLVPPVRLATDRVAETWGVAIPPAVSARLCASLVGRLDRTAFAIMTAPRGNARFFLDAISQPSIKLKAQFVTQHLFPARAYMRERYQIREERWMPLYYVWRLIEGPWRMLRSIVSTIARQ